MTRLTASERFDSLFALHSPRGPQRTKESQDSITCFCIAEIGVNHNGRLDLAYQLINAAALAGADAVKFQLFNPDELVSADTPLALYQQRSQAPEQWPQEELEASEKKTIHTQGDMLRQLSLPRAIFPELKRYTESLGLMFLCSPFDEESARYLIEDLDIAAIKLGSGELTNTPLLQQLGQACKRHAKPLILSTGMSHTGEIWDALMAVGKDVPVAILHCTSAYPAPSDQLNLRAIQTLHELFPNRVIGYSDHSLSPLSSPLAVGLGAKIIEKHLTLDTSMTGPDHAASIAPDDFATMIQQIRDVEAMLGNGEKRAQPCEQDCLRVARKSLVSRHALQEGHILELADIAIKRPGTGLPPSHRDRVVGQTLQKSIPADCVMTPDLFAPGLPTDTPQPSETNRHCELQRFPRRLSYSTRQLWTE